MTTSRSPRWLPWTPVLPLAFLAFFLAYPVARLVGTALADTGVRGLLPHLTASGTWQVAGLAAGQAAISTVLALAVGLPVANVVSRYRFWGRPFVQALMTVPFVLPTVVVALAIRSLVGDGAPQGLALVVVAHAYVNLAVVVRIVGSRWAQVDGSLEVVARTLGASRTRAFADVTWPALRSSVATSATVVFVFCFTSLGIVLLLGDPTTRTLEYLILRQTSVLLDFPAAAATAIVQLVVVTVVLTAGLIAGRRAPRRPARAIRLRTATGPARVTVLAVAIAAAALVVAPVVALVVRSVRVNGGWGLDWWLGVASVDAGTTRLGAPLAAIGVSVGYATITAVVAGVVGALAAIALLTSARFVTVLALLPLGVSAATLGLGTLLAFGRAPLDLRGTGLLVPIAHSLVAVPLVVAVLSPALRSADRRLVAVAAGLGAGPTRAFWTAYGPVLRVTVVAAAGLAAAVSLGEFGAASFLARTGAPTVPVQIVRLLGRPGEQSVGVAAVLAVVLVALTMAILLGVDRLAAGPRARAPEPLAAA